MISSGMKRGLAATAISALAVTGIPALATSASAVTLASSVASADSVYIATPDVATVSTKNDGTDTTVRLEVVGGNNVSSVKFEYSLGGAFTAISTVTRNDNGAFSYEWTPAGLDGGAVTIRATGLAADGTTVTGTDTQGVTVSSTANSVNVASGTATGVFQKPDYDGAGADTAANNVIVSGTSSAPASTPALKFWDDDTDGATAGNQPGWAGAATATSTTAAGATTGTWAGVLDITGYNFSATDELLVKATDVTDDSEAYALYKQVITTVTATADRTQVPAGQSANITVTVKDQNGNPIAGAEVRSDDGTLVGQTDRKGQVPTTQNPGTHYYYANTTASDPFEPEIGDKKSDSVTVTQYAPAATTLAGASNDGAAFDTNEYALGDITVQVKDQNGNKIDTTGQVLKYYWVVTPFAGGTPVRVPATGADSQPASTNGKYIVPLPAGQPDGTYELFAGLDANGLGNGAVASSKVLTVKEGDSNITYDQGSPEQALAGTSEPVSGKLTLADGTGLVNRQIHLTYAATAGTDTTPDSGLVQSDGTVGAARDVKTDAAGAFTVTVKDKAETPQGTESGKINGNTVDSDFANNDGVNDGNAAENAPTDHEVDFIASVTPGTVVISNQDAPLESPGEVETFTVTVTSADQDPNTPGVQSVPLSNQAVNLTTDHGYFTDGTPVVTAGGQQGVYDNDGQSKTVTTDNNGVATFKISIGRDAGFDDDGLVTSGMTAKAGSVSDTQDQDWTSETPLNAGGVSVVFSPNELQESAILPKAPLSDEVSFDVLATDQFGNVVGGEPIDLSDNTAFASLSATAITSDYALNGDFTATSTRAVDQIVKASWTHLDNVYNTATPPAPVTKTNTVTGTKTVNWYAVDYANSVFTLTHTGADTQPVGSTVTETYTAIDQNGEPIADLYVKFFRNGPDNQQDGDGNADGTLGQDGKIQYVFQGTAAGTATTTAVGYENFNPAGNTGDVVEASKRSDSVSFAAKQTAIHATITARHIPATDTIAGYDKMVVNAQDAGADATVALYRVKDGVAKKVKSKVLGTDGKAIFKRADLNGDKKNYYYATVSATATTKSGKTAIVSVK